METTAPRTSFLAGSVVPATPISDQLNTQIHAITAKPKHRRRRLDRQSGHAIEILGHAIQYLADEFALECMDPAFHKATAPNPRMEAIELLMSFNRQIYMSCPQVPTLSDRLRSLFSL